MTWYLIVFTLHMLTVEHGTGVVQVVKFPDAPACQKARSETDSDGIGSVCTSSLKDADGFIAAMSCNDSHLSKLPNGTIVARFSCTPEITAPQ